MLDPALCDRPVGQWLSLKGIISDWLTNPTLVLVTLSALTGLPWVIPKLPWRRQLSSVGAALLLLYCTAFFPPAIGLANRGLVGLLPADPGGTTDAIVVLGRGAELRDSRVEVADQLWRANRSPLIFASGRGDGSLIVSQLKAKGIPSTALENEHCSQTTEENARFTAAVLQPREVRRILLVTDPPHMLRSLLTFRSVGFTVIPHVSPLPADLGSGEEALTVFYEYMGLIKYALQGRFFSRRFPELDNPKLAVLGRRANFRTANRVVAQPYG